MEFIKNLFQYLAVINVNAFNTIWYILTKNWFLLVSVIFMVIFIYFEIKGKEQEYIHDEREMF